MSQTTPSTIPNTDTDIGPADGHTINDLVGVINQAHEGDEIYVHSRTSAEGDTEMVSGRAGGLYCHTCYGVTRAAIYLIVDEMSYCVAGSTYEPDGLDVRRRPYATTPDNNEQVNVDRAARVFVPNPGVSDEDVDV